VVAAGILMVVLALRPGLFDIDEGYYASVAREMIHTGDYLIPRFGGIPFLEKPPLLFWLMTFFLKLGITPLLAVRLPSILAATATLGMVGWFSFRRGAGLLAVGGLALSPLFLGLGHLAFTDMLLTCFLTATFLLFWLSISGLGQWLRLPAAAMLGLAVLTKGPAAAVLFALVAGATLIVQPQLRGECRKYWFESALVFLAVAAPWYYIIYKKLGKAFFQEFILMQNLGRLRGQDVAHLGPIYFYIPVLLTGLFPWSLYLPSLARRCAGDPFSRYCWTWFLVVFILFTLSRTKLPSYILPLFPAVALLLPTVPAEMNASSAPGRAWARPMAWAFGFAVAFAITLFEAKRLHGVPPDLGAALQTSGVALAVGVAIAAAVARMLRWEVGHIAAPLLLGASLSVPLTFAAVPAWYEQEQGDIHALAVAMRPEVERGAPYILYRITHPGHPSVMFDLGRPGLVGSEEGQLLRAVREPGLIVITPAAEADGVVRLGGKRIVTIGRYAAVRVSPVRAVPPPQAAEE
jgi:4-amino-4-deoxy-L-arabinose transferase-like glycosyltransferase